MSGISKQEGGIPMKISKKMLAAAVLAFAFGVAGCGGGGGSSGDPTPKKRRSKSACSGDGRLYFIDKELKSTDGKEVKKAFKYGYMWLAEGSTAGKAYIYGENGAYGTGKLADGVVTDFQAGAFNSVASIGAIGDNQYPMKSYKTLVAEGDTLYFAAQSVEKKGDTSHVAVAVTADGQLIRRYGAENRQDPSFMFMMDGLTVMPKYLVVAVSNGSFHVFDKADGKFLGKAKTEDMFGEEMKINGMAKVDENTFAIQYRTSKKDKDGNYGYALATITMK
jgi:hypothetical protein